MSNISIILPHNCCGCEACLNICPTNAIKMDADLEGFLYPSVDNCKCIDCGICLEACKDSIPFNNELQNIYSYYSVNEDVRSRSSSGGAFSMIAEIILNKGGVVYGAGFNSDYTELIHVKVTTFDELDNIRRSKFIQSRKSDIYTDVQQKLDSGVIVLFTGTPCEVGGLKTYLQKDYDSLYTCDLICGCVSSPKVYKKYIDEMKQNFKSEVVFVNFKDKRNGWRNKAISINFSNGEEYYNSILDDYYVVSFHSRFNIRPSCFNCKYRSLLRISDFTLGDFWGIENIDKTQDDNKGVSFVLVNTRKGTDLLAKNEDLHFLKLDLEEYSIKYNSRIDKNPELEDWSMRKAFYKDLENSSFSVVAEKYLREIKEKRKLRKMQK
ncbi:Coenzyme F420-reducing hydrogenase, beta subunit [Bacteroides faecichinchillae]|uniref:Coenzyme F420-reducing hydrogenase, beta subunit n=1 Tax=Bacteroides faecichinchillae TaxID=871325 RepID=A0A1M5BQC3_9BACE|nr:hypothetical protein E5981_14920 [Bacteroides faecichinchillae]SHF44699.1 Coenzyme F420-reducing hydrogenase, beta subunit [Bacteroides faecichinchillae]